MSQNTPDHRFLEIDCLRGIALLGIYWINVVIFALPHGAYSLPHLLGREVDINVALWAFSEVFVEGTMRGLFSILFGASAFIFLDQARLASNDGVAVVERYYRRCLFLMVFGLVHAYILLAQWDVLFAYGLLGLFLFPLRRLSPGWLILAALTLFAISDFNSWTENVTELSEIADTRAMSKDAASAYRDELRSEYLSEFEKDFETYKSGYIEIFLAQAPLIAEQQSTKIYTDYIFDIGGMLLFGMALMRLGVLTGQRSLQFYVVMSLAGYGLGGLLRGVECYELWLAGFYPEARDPMLLMPYNLGRIAMTLGHIGLFGILIKLGCVEYLSRYFAAVGRMALTNYVGQTVISVLIFYGFGLGYYGAFEPYQLVSVFLAVAAFQIVASNMWLRTYRIGPLEWLWRSMAYGRYQPLLRHDQRIVA